MNLQGELYQFQKDKLFRHRVYLKKCMKRGQLLVNRIYWIPREETSNIKFRIDNCPEYYKMWKIFFDKCRQINLPFHNAIAFWNRFLKVYPKLTTEDQYSFIMLAVCNYGDFFEYATTRRLPENIVSPVDLMSFKEQPSDEFQEDVFNQINHIRMNLPELELGIEGFDRFRGAWNFQLRMAQDYQQWKVRYASLKLESYGANSLSSLDTLKPLVRIFRQYIHMLNEHANSAKHSKFEPRYNEFKAGVHNELFYSFDRVVFLLKEHEVLAIIAPMYVLGIFQQLTKKLYTGLSDTSTTQLKVNLDSSSKSKLQLYDSAKSNTKVPRNIQVITYQILCEYFKGCEFLKTPYDRGLCNHILQSNLSLIGQCYFEVDGSYVDNIIHSEKCYHLGDLTQSDHWIHFLLGEIDNRLGYSLVLDSDSILKISFTDIMPPHSKKLIDDAKKLVDSNFIKRYLEYFILPPLGLGCQRISEWVQVDLANLMDLTLAKARLTPSAFDPSYARKLLAYETGFHSACADRIYDQYRMEVLSFLYSFFQSDAFLSGEIIPDGWGQRQGDDITVWPPPHQPPNKLNIDNRADFEYSE